MFHVPKYSLLDSVGILRENIITKDSLYFPTKVWWIVIHVQLRPTTNDNTLPPSLTSLVACLMDGYPVNVGLIIASK